MVTSIFLRIFGLTRVVLGLWLVAAPQRPGESWFGELDHAPSTTVLLRSVGGRDVALGLGLAANPSPDSAWLLGGIIADVVDAGGSFLVRDRLPRSNFLNGFAAASTYAVIGTAIALLGRKRGE